MKPTASLFNPDPYSGYLVVFIDGKQYTVNASDSQFTNAVNAFKSEDWESLFNILNPTAKIQSLYAKYEQIEVKDGNVFVNDEAVNSLVAERILQFLDNGIDCVPVFKFVIKLQNNPSKRAVDELYTFLEHKNLPITESGNFLAYKAVRENYTDVHTGQFYNTVNSVLSMARNKVDDNKENGCSYGFHAGTLEYASGFRPHNGKMMIVEIDPSDVVSIPTDSDCQKLRTCRYKVVGEYENTLTKPLYESKFQTEVDEDIWPDDVCDECGNCEDDCECDYSDEPEGGCMADYDMEGEEHPWDVFDNVPVDDLLSILYSNRMPALANKLRKGLGNTDPVGWNNVNSVLGNSDANILYKLYKNN